MTSTNVPELPQPTASKGIWFGDYCFSEPVVLPCFVPDCNSGLYAILVDDATCHPRSMRVLYFGESENISTQLSPWHDKYWSWCDIAGSAMKLYAAFLPMEGSTADHRRAIAAELIAQYQPECNADR